MPTYSFKQEAKVFVVTNNQRHNIDVSDVEFSQTFATRNYPVKTLHNLANVFEASVINRANAANFTFRVPAIVEGDYTVLHTLLLDASLFDLYVTTEAETFKLENAVITNGSFVIERSRPLSIEIQGEASKLTLGATLAGTLQTRSATSNYTLPSIDITIGSASLSNVASIGIELQNDIEWIPYTTVHGGQAATDASTSMYPTTFALKSKILSGSIAQYLTSDDTNISQTWNNSETISIKAGNGESGTNFRGFSFGPATCTFTNRMNAGTVFTQNYDWRMTENPTSLGTILKYETD